MAPEKPDGITLGLERITRFLEQVLPTDPRAQLRVVHVAGTNGKGSVCALVSTALIAAGYRVGTFNSPHFLEPNDAVRLQGVPIPKDEYQRLRQWIEELDTQALAEHGRLSQFEQTTALALWWFAQSSVDIAVVEVGLGGQRDATNVFGAADGQRGVGRSLVQCICPVDEDHLGLIGNNVEEIAREKAGIMRPGSWIVIANQDRSEAFHKIRQVAHRVSPGRIINVRRQPTYDIHVPNFAIAEVPARLRAPLALPSWATFNGTGKRCLRAKYPASLDAYIKSNHARRASDEADTETTERVEVDLPLELPGYYQAGNASVAFYALDVLRTQFGFTQLTDAAIQVGFQNVRWPGRLSWLRIAASGQSSGTSSPGSGSGSEGRTEQLNGWVLADGAHNEPAAVELRKYVDTTLRRVSQQRYIRGTLSRQAQGALQVRWVVGFSRGKDVAALLARLVQAGDVVWAVPFAKPQEMPWISCEQPEAIAEAVQKLGMDGVAVEVFGALGEAVDRLAGDQLDGYLNVICGSLYLVSDVYRVLQVEPFPADPEL